MIRRASRRASCRSVARPPLGNRYHEIFEAHEPVGGRRAVRRTAAVGPAGSPCSEHAVAVEIGAREGAAPATDAGEGEAAGRTEACGAADDVGAVARVGGGGIPPGVASLASDRAASVGGAAFVIDGATPVGNGDAAGARAVSRADGGVGWSREVAVVEATSESSAQKPTESRVPPFWISTSLVKASRPVSASVRVSWK